MSVKRIILQIAFFFLIVPMSFGQVRTVNIEGHDNLRYTVETIKAKPGEKLKIVLKTVSVMDKSMMAHNWVLLKLGTDAMNFATKGLEHQDNDFIDPALKDKIIAKTKLVGNGEEDSVTFTVPQKKGTYTYLCTFRGHFQAGMKGKLIVE
ncbi:MAG TPA: plastocyanin/azurin family copper-binding protein [Sunxiuqinia sp.]|nr:plastocyanin/azurin family copper-binding protein [Sunxiuqinia sp.]